MAISSPVLAVVNATYSTRGKIYIFSVNLSALATLLWSKIPLPEAMVCHTSLRCFWASSVHPPSKYWGLFYSPKTVAD